MTNSGLLLRRMTAISSLLVASLIGAPAFAAVDYTPGDLIVGFHATGGTGSTETFAFNLGAATAYRDQVAPVDVFNIGPILSSLYGPDWFSRNDLYWGIAGNRTSSPYGEAVNGDPRRTVYVSRAAAAPGASSPWMGYGPALGTASTQIQSFLSGESGGFFRHAAAAGTDNRGAIIPTSFANSWEVYNPQPGAAFQIFTGGIEGAFGTSGSQVHLDVYRILFTTEGADPTGPVGDGVRIATFSLDSSGNLTVAYPASAEPTAREAWRAQYGLPVDGSGLGADSASPANDGIPNLIKYALGLNPNVNERGSLPVAAFVEEGGQEYLSLTATKNPDATDVLVAAEISENLVDWMTAPAELVVVLDTASTLSVRDARPISDLNRRFIRIKVTNK